MGRIAGRIEEVPEVCQAEEMVDVREIEILGTSVSLSEEGLGREASGKRRRALLEGLGSIEESKTVNSTAVKGWDPEESRSARRRRRNAGGNGEDEFGGLVAAGQVGRALRRERDMHEDGEPDTRRREKVQDGMQIPEGSGGDVGDAGVDTRPYDRGCARGLGLGRRAQ